MVQIENLALVLTGVGLIASIIYYASILRNANRTQQMQLENRQAQLFMNIYSKLLSNEAIDNEFILNDIEMKTADDYWRIQRDPDKYRAMTWFMVYYEGIGVLVRENHVSIELVAQMISGNILWYWETFGDAFIDLRSSWPRFMVELEYLYERVKEYLEEAAPDASGVSPELVKRID